MRALTLGVVIGIESRKEKEKLIAPKQGIWCINPGTFTQSNIEHNAIIKVTHVEYLAAGKDVHIIKK